MKRTCNRCVALENLQCRLGYPMKRIPSRSYSGDIIFLPSPIVECPKPLTYDAYHHAEKYKVPDKGRI